MARNGEHAQAGACVSRERIRAHGFIDPGEVMPIGDQHRLAKRRRTNGHELAKRVVAQKAGFTAACDNESFGTPLMGDLDEALKPFQVGRALLLFRRD